MTSREGKGVTQNVRVSSYGEGGWPNRHITLQWLKKLNLQFILLYLR